ncbi:acyl-CoA/acyl-ACP dehydrogenase [Kibdelosporangium philippinense]|uniref:Acyl-CoA/acyl-ACP dehydrogenase n=1 Tax=Kibdelosporangium philippinense TaxID=211113 RepID=A0ABS8Z035_9PSEU|nr:acyl-CoA dehydrogenase family protein [Kibdelosporangium philippinense]MCE7001336.1 acyl-CoA/acyl-ACP dehydrogenase [Kibdelosporangium philippinense]
MLSAEHDDLRDAVRHMLSRGNASWSGLCQQIGVAGLAVPEQYGGAGATLLEAHVVLEETGRMLAPVPMLSATVAAQALLLSERADLLPEIVEGTTIATVLWADSVSETVRYVLDGDTADVLIVSTPDGLFLGDSTHRVHTPTMDESKRLATVRLSGGTRIGPPAPQLRDIALVAQTAEQVGAAQQCLDMTVEYTKTRVQFGRPIGSFQALKHRMADMYVRVETARSISYAAVENPDLAAAATAYCGETLSFVAGEMIQLHGGIAITWEHDAHRYFKRAHNSAQLFGQPHEHVTRISRAL